MPNLGWECPRCHQCYAPSVKKCKECKPVQVAQPVAPYPYWIPPWYFWPYYSPAVPLGPVWVGYQETTATKGFTFDGDGKTYTVWSGDPIGFNDATITTTTGDSLKVSSGTANMSFGEGVQYTLTAGLTGL